MQDEVQIGPGIIPPAAGRGLAAIGLAGIVSASALTAFFDPSASHFFPVCPLYTMTGLACPGCGLTRGFHALFHGDVGAAVHFNALIFVWVVVLGYVSISLLLLAIRGKGLPMWPTRPRFLWTFLIVLLIFGVIRNLPLYPFTLLYP